MGYAFQITEEDIGNVLSLKFSINATDDEENTIYELLNDEMDRIENVALNGGDSLDEQVDAAYDELRQIFIEKNIVLGVKYPGLDTEYKLTLDSVKNSPKVTVI